MKNITFLWIFDEELIKNYQYFISEAIRGNLSQISHLTVLRLLIGHFSLFSPSFWSKLSLVHSMSDNQGMS